jgi:N-acetylmuramidase/Putative peptidoglycan binding domain
MRLEFVGKAQALSAEGFASCVQSLSVKAPEIWAVLAVETSGCGFLPDRRPQILFERHVFHRLTGGRFDDGDISDPTPGGYGSSGKHQYDRLSRAIAKDRTAALQSASWGLGQILGENCAIAGFADVETMVAAMSDSEDAQLQAVCAFIKHSKLDVCMQAHDWASFARKYNGPGYAKNQYDVHLRGEYAKYSVGALPNLDVRAAQLYLTFCGYHPGPIDGSSGTMTRAAIAGFQATQGLPKTGEVDDTLLARLAEAAQSLD